MPEVIVVGAGPAGAVAATVLARAGVRVRLIDRAAFPRDKLCGDTVNPGALAILRRLKLATTLDARGLRVDGMTVTGNDGVRVDGHYPSGLFGRAIIRREMDMALVQEALDAGAEFETGVPVARAVLDEGRGTTVTGVAVAVGRSEQTIFARVVIAADGRRSKIAFGLGLAHHPARPRRWAVGAYFENVSGVSSVGEMHIRKGHYIGVAPLPGGLVNVCLVRAWQPVDGALRDPETLLRAEIARDKQLRGRFADARLLAPPVVLGPLAVDVSRRSFDGLLLAGDAAGFIDPMTGDGLRFAVRGGELAAQAAMDALEHGWSGVHERLRRQRQREFERKWVFNRALRSLVASAAAVRAGEAFATLAPAALQAVVRHAGDCRVALQQQ